MVGSVLLSNVLKQVDKSMLDNDILPTSFSAKANICSTEKDDDDVMDMAPITLGCKDNVDSLRGLVITVRGTRGQYIVPLSCPEKRYKVPSGLGSTLVVNNVVLMFPDVPQYLVNQDQRKPNKEELGFLCCTSSATSAALKGLVRYTVCDVVCRCCSCGVSDDISALCAMLDSRPCDCNNCSNKTVFMVSGVKITMCESCTLGIEMLVRAMSSKKPHCLNYVKVISFSTGTLMRWDKPHQCWVDSKTSIDFNPTYRNLISPAIALVPSLTYINPVRASLVNVYMNQAICTPYNNYFPGTTLIPLYAQCPCVLSDNCNYDSLDSLRHIPGLNMFCIFVNLELTYEDGMVMSRSAASRFKYVSTTSVYLDPHKYNIPQVDDVIMPFSVAWWQNHFIGTVIKIQPGPNTTVKITIESKCTPVNGDKFTTWHGQKGVITILEDEEMPIVNNKYAEIVIGSSSIVKRGTTSQLIEAACGMFATTYMDSSIAHSTETILQSYMSEFRVRKNPIDSILSRYEGEVQFNDKTAMRKIKKVNGISMVSRVRANYGFIRVMQSCFVASTRMSSTYECASVHSTSINTKSSYGGSKSLGEMECMQLMASGMNNCMQEFVERSNMCNVQVCRTCRCLRIVCISAKDNIVNSDSVVSNVDIIGMPYKSIVSIVSWKVGFDINTRLDL